MLYISLDQAKKHLNIEEEFCEDDLYIESLIQVAQNAVEMNICTPLSTFQDEDGLLPPALRQCILFLMASYYANRESLSSLTVKEIPYTYQYLINLYRNYGSGTTE